MKKIFTVFLLFVGLMIQAQTIYYIDPTGNNGNNGSIGSPWLTLTYACAHAKISGDIIHVNAGTYSETSQCNLAVGVSIEGVGVTSIIKSTVSGAYGSNVHTFQLFSSTLTNGNQHISNIKMDGGVSGTPTGYGAIRIQKRSNVEIYNCTFVDFTDWGVCYRGLYNGEREPTTWATGNKFHDNTVTNCSSYYWQSSYGSDYRNGNGQGCLEITEQEGMRVYNNILTQIGRPTWHNGYCIKGVMGYNRDLKIYNNTLTKEPFDGLTWDFAIELWLCRGGIEIYDNTINGGSIDISGSSTESGNSTQKGSYAYALYIHGNTIGPPTLSKYDGTHGILVEQSATDVIIERNHIKNVWAGIYCPLTSKSDGTGTVFNNITIRYNLLENIGTSGDNAQGFGIHNAWAVTNMTSDNVQYYNNTIIGRSGSDSYGIMLPAIGTATNVYVRNNIIKGFSGIDSYGIYSLNQGTINNAWIQYNALYRCGNNNAPRYGQTITNLTYESSYSGSLPPFVSSSDFHLTTSINGVNITTGLTDLDGVSVPNPPDIGAYEFIGNDPPSIKDQGFQMKENSPDGTQVGTVVASDPDAGQKLAYSIVSGNTNGAFGINALTGVLSVANGAALNVDFALVVKVQDNGISELSSLATITINIEFTGIGLTGNNRTIKVYPNPVSDELIIELKGNNDRLSFNILNSIGQIVFEGKMSEKAVVQTTSFSPGIYLLKIENCRPFEFKKIVKV